MEVQTFKFRSGSVESESVDHGLWKRHSTAEVDRADTSRVRGCQAKHGGTSAES